MTSLATKTLKNQKDISSEKGYTREGNNELEQKDHQQKILPSPEIWKFTMLRISYQTLSPSRISQPTCPMCEWNRTRKNEEMKRIRNELIINLNSFCLCKSWNFLLKNLRDFLTTLVEWLVSRCRFSLLGSKVSWYIKYRAKMAANCDTLYI